MKSGQGLVRSRGQRITLEFEQLLDQQYQQELSDRVKALGAHAVILKNREVLYSTKKFNEIDIEKSLMLSDQAA